MHNRSLHVLGILCTHVQVLERTPQRTSSIVVGDTSCRVDMAESNGSISISRCIENGRYSQASAWTRRDSACRWYG